MSPPRTSSHEQPIPLSVWILTLTLVVVAVLLLLSLTLPKVNENPVSIVEIVDTKRLNRIKNHGVVVLGSSLVSYGFAYDEAFDQQAAHYKLTTEMVRFTYFGAAPRGLDGLFQLILESNPRWVFIQTEPFVIDFTNRFPNTLGINQFSMNLHNRVNYLLTRLSLISLRKFEEQTDFGLTLDKTAPLVDLRPDWDVVLRPPPFPESVESFVQAAKVRNIRVILLEMNRSKWANDSLGPDFQRQLNLRLQTFANHYRIPLWQFRSDLPLENYVDRAHLNRKGRGVFMDWFLQRLAKEENRHE